jgi:diguanylate cyclase (GGDEF)-like protein/PAS domain S-box-containing protein
MTGMTFPRTTPRHLLVAVAATGYLVIATVFALKLVPPATLSLLSGLSLIVASISAGVAGLVRSSRVPDPRIKSSWQLLGAAAIAWGGGQTVTVFYELMLDEDAPFPSFGDVGYLLAVPLWAAGLLYLAMPAHQVATRIRAVLDGLLIGIALLLVSWVTVLGPVAHSSTDLLINKMILLAYPVGDVALVTLVAYVVLRFRASARQPPVPLKLIAVALGAFAVADSGYAYLSLAEGYSSGSAIDAGWLGGFTLLLIAALLPNRPAEQQATPHTRPLGVLLPYFFVVVAAIISSLVNIDHTDIITRWIRTSMILLMVARQVLTLLENSQLTRTLERRVDDRTAELELSKDRFRALVEHSSDVVSLISSGGELIYQSESSMRVFGYPGSELLGRRFAELLDQPSRIKFNAAMTMAAKSASWNEPLQLRLIHGDGAWRQVETTVTNLLKDPAVQALVLNTRDVSERRELEDQLLHQAFHDSLTGLANRALFHDRVQHAMRRRTLKDSVGVLFLDLDGFKEVNDSLGHSTGDALLIEVAARLNTCVRPGDTIARLGGDEFAILVEGAKAAIEFVAVAERIRTALDAAVVINGSSLSIRASIGIASADLGTNDADQLIRNADLAMYRAKELRDGEFAIYDPSMHSTLVERLALEAELRLAVDQELLHVHYQPTYTLDTGKLVGVEALIRWNHPERGQIPPDAFISLAEQTGLIHQLGLFVLREACHQGRRWLEQAPGTPLSIAVNISGKQLQRIGFADEVRSVLVESGLPPESLVLEMTESVLMDDTDGSVRALAELKAMGIRIAIDDFGTGYSSLSYLHKFPVDILKIDRSFVERLSGAFAEESLVQSIVQLAQTLHLETIAEGIEDHGQLLALRRLGCQIAQGYHFGRPGPPDLVGQLLIDINAESKAALEAGPIGPAEAIEAVLANAVAAAVPGPREGELEEGPTVQEKQQLPAPAAS